MCHRFSGRILLKFWIQNFSSCKTSCFTKVTICPKKARLEFYIRSPMGAEHFDEGIYGYHSHNAKALWTNWALCYLVRYKFKQNESYYLMPYNSWADVVRLLAERYATKSNEKLGGFWSQLQAFYVSSHTEELWYNKTVCLWMTIYVVHSISFQTFFVQSFKIVVDSWKFSMLLLYILWDNWPIFMISASNEQLQQQLEYTLLKPDCQSWWISKMQSRCEDILEEQYTIKFCFKLGKNATETYGMLQTAFWPSCINQASVFEWHKRFKEGRESVRDDERYGRSKEVNTPQLIGQRVRVKVIMLRF